MACPRTTGITSATWETTQPRPAGRMLHGNSDAGWKLGGLAPWSTYFTNQVALTSLWTNPFGPQFHKVQMKIFEPDGLQGCVKPGHCKPGAARSCRGMWRHISGTSLNGRGRPNAACLPFTSALPQLVVHFRTLSQGWIYLWGKEEQAKKLLRHPWKWWAKNRQNASWQEQLSHYYEDAAGCAFRSPCCRRFLGTPWISTGPFEREPLALTTLSHEVCLVRVHVSVKGRLHSFIYSFIKQMCLEYLLCVRHSRYRDAG